jgi:AcrR family transcriptional regulator
MPDGGGTKERIERAALRLFVEKGVNGASIRDIAQAVGLSDGALYRHYASKEDLVWQLFAEAFEGFARELAGLASAEAGTRRKLAAMVRGFCALFDHDSLLFRFLLLVQHGLLERVRPEMTNPVEVVRQVIAEGMEREEIPRGDANLAAAMVMGIILQTATFKVYGRIRRPLGELAPTLARAAWTVLKCEQERSASLRFHSLAREAREGRGPGRSHGKGEGLAETRRRPPHPGPLPLKGAREK